MKRDIDLIRKILLTMENQKFVEMLQSDGYTQDEINYHCYLLKDGGYLEGIEIEDLNNPFPSVIPLNLTWKGHDFLSYIIKGQGEGF